MKRVKKFLVCLLILGLLSGCILPDSMSVTSHAADTSAKGAIEYCTSSDGKKYTDSAEEAFRACRYGGEISFISDYHLDIKEWTQNLVCSERTLVEVKPGVTLTLGKGGLKMHGQLQIWGTVDLKNSQGDLWGTDQVYVRTGGRLEKRSYEVTRVGDTAFSTKPISYGQPISEVEIEEDTLCWKSSIEGKWVVLGISDIFGVGTWQFPVLFKPEHPFTYDETFYANATVIRVNHAFPKLQKGSIPEIHYGESLAGVTPQGDFVNPYSEEPIEGTLSFYNEGEILKQTGEQEVLTVFSPKDTANYATGYQYMKINVLPVTPDVVAYPQPCNGGEEGQLLQDIRLLPGTCRNPYTGKDVKGSWEWKEPLRELQPGENSYPVVFVPEESGYKVREGSLTLNVSPKAAAPSISPSTEDRTETTPSPTGNQSQEASAGTGGGQQASQKITAASTAKPPIVITRMVSQRSTIRFSKKKTLSAKAKITKIKRSGSKAKVVCKKIAKVKYQLQYSTGKKWKSARKKSSASSVMKIRKLKAKKKYYFRVRAWKKVNKEKIYGKWSGVKQK